MLALSKSLTPLISPGGVVLAVGVIAVLFWLLRRPRTAIGLAVLALGLLWIVCTPAFESAATGLLESRYPAVAVPLSPDADVIIILGGGALPRLSSAKADASDERLTHAFDLFKAGKAPAILVSGGDRIYRPGAPTDADDMRNLLTRLGVSPDAILADASSRDTEENAQNCLAIMRAHGMSSALLVTSAIHMPRAMAAFKRAGIDALPSPADFSAPSSTGWAAWLPDRARFWRDMPALHEIAGLVYYVLRGWA